MLHIIVTYELKEDKAAEFIAEIEASGAAKLVREEDGCRQYDYFVSPSDPRKAVLLEQWDSKQQQAVHMTQPHMVPIMTLKDKYCSSVSVKFLYEE